MSSTAEITTLHVDDDPSFLDLASTYVERRDEAMTVLTETSASDGLDRLDAEPVDCIVSDYQMPGMDGLEFLDAVRDSHPEFPFLLFTGKGSEEIASDAISAGVTDYLQKGGTEQYTVLANRVQNAVEQYRAKHALAESERRLQTLVDNLPGLVYRADIDDPWPMTFVGGRAEEVTGYPAERFERGDVTFGDDLILDEDEAPLKGEIGTAVADREPFEVTYRIQTADGETKQIWERGEPIFEDGTAVALEGFIMELTDRSWPETD